MQSGQFPNVGVLPSKKGRAVRARMCI